MIISTTFQIDGYQQSNHKFISAEVVLGVNAFKDFMASITNIVGGRSTSYEKAFIEGKNMCMDELIKKANDLGADAIVGVDLAYSSVGPKNAIFVINITGTAVTLTK